MDRPNGEPTSDKPRIVVVGGGFAGLAAVRGIDAARFDITLLDRENYHLFQPLLYQVATGSLAATDIATPLRAIVAPAQARVVRAELSGLDLEARCVHTECGSVYPWDTLVLALGLSHNYFGHDNWAKYAPSLKFLDDAFNIRDRVLGSLEIAESTKDAQVRAQHMRFVVVGGGPTGVELAGAIGELTGRTLARDFTSFDPRECEVTLIEAGSRLLPQYSEAAADEARQQLEQLGVRVLTSTQVLSIEPRRVTLSIDGNTSEIVAETIIWAAGAAADPTFQGIARAAGLELDRAGRLLVESDFRVLGHPNLFALGDLAAYKWQGQPLPGLAPAAEQSGTYVAAMINGTAGRFHYKHSGQLAVIGRNAATGTVLKREVKGRLAWWLWLFVHIRGIIGFDVKLKVMVIWAWKFIFDKYGARVIGRATKRSQSPES